MKYWKQGFYDAPIDGAVEITEERWHELLDGQASGMEIYEDASGVPQLRTPAGPTPEEIDTMRIAELKGYLTTTDWCIVKCLETGVSMAETYPEVLQAREAARTEINELEARGGGV
ncbi:hypothetical protein [Alistipes senegalensis]|uniref:hypothetical protein n=1 Tax=Alistipes senegalensis TaxID=1288121 RepID=UPI00242CCBBD|nr:hypothetical protein [Alistipes senegalensis]MCI7307113.1 hypothetical protein [Alistipes senegalensis]MDD7039693.1 hypothetical protein [Alistipes senegalensis]